jgi:hypothetical protein
MVKTASFRVIQLSFYEAKINNKHREIKKGEGRKKPSGEVSRIFVTDYFLVL